MKCPYCEKENFIPYQPKANAERYGSKWFNFNCTKCGKTVRAFFSKELFKLVKCKKLITNLTGKGNNQ